ncbi:hypothetical protein CJU89_6909 [Yarrowia sp. B02]|nr:hypothetical protein CJU89_6909 [Yarrowia sp. B02]
MVKLSTAYQAVALGALSSLVLSELAQCVFETPKLAFLTCPPESYTKTIGSPTMTVTVAHKRKPTTPLELLEDALEKQGLLIKKDEFMSKGPLQKENTPIPTVPFDSDMKDPDRDMYAPLLAHYPTRGFFKRLGRLMAFGMWMKTECIEKTWVVANGELTILQGVGSRDREIDKNAKRQNFLVLDYRSTGNCEFFSDHLERVTKHASKLYEFEYEGQRPDAVCIYVEKHEGWVEQIVMGYNLQDIWALNCTAE